MLTENQNESLTSLIKKFFSERFLREALELLKGIPLNVSFIKGTWEKYFVISGIFSHDKTYQTRLSVREAHNVENAQIKSSCTCKQWNEVFHCPHTLVLLIRFFTETQGEQNFSLYGNDQGQGVSAKSFGTMIRRPTDLQQGPNATSFLASRYRLLDGSVITFPGPKPLTQKLQIRIIPKASLELQEHLLRHPLLLKQKDPVFCDLQFSLPEQEKISLLSSLYVFNWQSGEAFSLPLALSEALKKIESLHLTKDEFINLLAPLTNEIDLFVDSQPFNALTIPRASLRLFLSPSRKSIFWDAGVEVLSPEGTRLSLPYALILFALKDGVSDLFNKNHESFVFLKLLLSSLSQKPSFEYRSFLRSSPFADHLRTLLDLNAEFYFTHQKQLYVLSTEKIKYLFTQMYIYWGDSFFKGSAYHKTEDILSYRILSELLMETLSDLSTSLEDVEIPIYFNSRPVRKWSSTTEIQRQHSSINWFDLSITLSPEDKELITKAQTHGGIAMLKDELVLIPKDRIELLEMLKNHFKIGQYDPKTQTLSVQLSKCRIFELFELKKMGIDNLLTTEEEKLCHTLSNLEQLPHYPIPENIKRHLRPYQELGYEWMRFLYENQLGACLADDMGLGKTLQTIVFLESILNQVQRILIVCPVSILMNWQKEFEKFSELKAFIYHGAERTFPSDAKIIITSYGIMKKEFASTFKNNIFDVLILDEVQHLKNLKTTGAFAARHLQAKFRICLTGTPLENDLAEFYNIIDLCVPGVWGDVKFSKSSPAESSVLARQVAKPYVLRRTKSQVLTELPPKEEDYIYLNFSEDEQQNYDKRLLAIRELLKVAPKNNQGEVLKSILELRLLCLWQRKNTLSTKVDFLLENLEQLLEEKHQVLIFSQFTQYLDYIESKIKEKKWKFSRLDGQKTAKQREEAITSFQNRDNPIFLISLKAGGQGLNLTSASYIFLMDPWWNPAVESQAIDRAYRIGQTQKLIVYKPIIKNSVEEKVLILQQDKRKLFEEVLNHDSGQFFSGKLNKDDFHFLLN